MCQSWVPLPTMGRKFKVTLFTLLSPSWQSSQISLRVKLIQMVANEKERHDQGAYFAPETVFSIKRDIFSIIFHCPRRDLCWPVVLLPRRLPSLEAKPRGNVRSSFEPPLQGQQMQEVKRRWQRWRMKLRKRKRCPLLSESLLLGANGASTVKAAFARKLNQGEMRNFLQFQPLLQGQRTRWVRGGIGVCVVVVVGQVGGRGKGAYPRPCCQLYRPATLPPQRLPSHRS